MQHTGDDTNMQGKADFSGQHARAVPPFSQFVMPLALRHVRSASRAGSAIAACYVSVCEANGSRGQCAAHASRSAPNMSHVAHLTPAWLNAHHTHLHRCRRVLIVKECFVLLGLLCLGGYSSLQSDTRPSRFIFCHLPLS